MIISEPEENYKTGWIKIYRSVTNKAWFAQGDYLKLWIYLLMQATHKEVEYLWNGKPIILKPGQFITGRKKISNEIRVSESSVERMLTYFEKTEQQIEQQKSNTSRLISIVNYSSYQTSEQPSGQRMDSGWTTDGQRMDTKQEHKEHKKEEYMSFLREVNRLTGKNYLGAAKVKSSFAARLKEGRTLDDFFLAVANAVTDPYHIETKFKYLTPVFFTRADKLDKFMNQVEKPKVVKEDTTDIFETRNRYA